MYEVVLVSHKFPKGLAGGTVGDSSRRVMFSPPTQITNAKICANNRIRSIISMTVLYALERKKPFG